MMGLLLASTHGIAIAPLPPVVDPSSLDPIPFIDTDPHASGLLSSVAKSSGYVDTEYPLQVSTPAVASECRGATKHVESKGPGTRGLEVVVIAIPPSIIIDGVGGGGGGPIFPSP